MAFGDEVSDDLHVLGFALNIVEELTTFIRSDCGSIISRKDVR